VAGPEAAAAEPAAAAESEVDPDAAEAPEADAAEPTEAPAAQDLVAEAEAETPTGEAALLGVTTTGAPSEPLAAAATGTHTLTILPVYWGSGTDGTSKATLDSLGRQTAQYWSEQSGGRVSTSVTTRDWVRIADPGSCATDTIMDRALAAHGVASPTATRHVLVYFPQYSSCGSWAGLASIGGGRIWVNGLPTIDVFAHEFGHNLGVGHANTMTCRSGSNRVPLSSTCTVNEYGDYADVMGIAMRNVTSGNLNTALADHLGFAKVVRTSGATTVDLAPLASIGATRAVAIPVSDGTLYFDYRPATGRDVRRTAWAGVQVHLQKIEPVYRYATSYLLDMRAPATGEFASPSLPVGSSFAVPGTNQVVTLESAGATARLRVSTGAASVDPARASVQSYVTRVYRDLFKRDVDPSGLHTWTERLLAGTPRVEVANAITSSTEYRGRLIASSYARFLGRTPDAEGQAFWLEKMRQGWTIQQMESGFLSSAEYYAKAGGNDAGWVRQLYRHVLGRSASAAEVSGWVGALGSGQTRASVALGFLLSTEHLTTVVDGYYREILGRSIDPSGRVTWVTNIQRGARVEQIIGGIVASEEYFNKR